MAQRVGLAVAVRTELSGSTAENLTRPPTHAAGPSALRAAGIASRDDNDADGDLIGRNSTPATATIIRLLCRCRRAAGLAGLPPGPRPA